MQNEILSILLLYIYMFIQHSLSVQFESCVSLYKKALQEEQKAVTQLSNDKDPNVTRDLMWAPFAFNGDIILAIAESGKIEAALDLIELLLSYPAGIRVGLGDRLLGYLKNLGRPYDRVKTIFDEMVRRDPLKHTDREEWMTKFPVRTEGLST